MRWWVYHAMRNCQWRCWATPNFQETKGRRTIKVPSRRECYSLNGRRTVEIVQELSVLEWNQMFPRRWTYHYQPFLSCHTHSMTNVFYWQTYIQPLLSPALLTSVGCSLLSGPPILLKRSSITISCKEHERRSHA